ncbi:MAG TPA: hypothetical protein VH183_11005 [Burkholderiaceae bacterium]|nr:hypothetical protein [Burkholderiaceae bacterium]
MNKSTVRGKAGASLLVAASALAATLTAQASPMVYTATVVTNIKVADHLYQNASVTVTFQGDSKDVMAAADKQGNAIPSTFCTSPSATGWFYYLAKGTTAVSVESQGRTLVAHLNPGQVFVGLDQCNGGIGFGSFVGPHGLEPAYPVAFVLGTAATDATSGSPLSTPANMSGFAWSCIGYPPNGSGALSGNGFCTPPDGYPLGSDIGDIVFYLPYRDINPSDGSICCNHYGALNFGTFSVRNRKDDD